MGSSSSTGRTGQSGLGMLHAKASGTAPRPTSVGVSVYRHTRSAANLTATFSAVSTRTCRPPLREGPTSCSTGPDGACAAAPLLRLPGLARFCPLSRDACEYTGSLCVQSLSGAAGCCRPPSSWPEVVPCVGVGRLVGTAQHISRAEACDTEPSTTAPLTQVPCQKERIARPTRIAVPYSQ